MVWLVHIYIMYIHTHTDLLLRLRVEKCNKERSRL
jgi:hypothetical protein